MGAAASEMLVTCGSCGARLNVSPGTTARTEKCPTCGTRLQIQAAAAPKRAAITIDAPPQGTFLFFPAAAAVPEIRSAPTAEKTRDRAGSRNNFDAISIGLVTVATLFAGIAASIAMARFGGAGLWVVKRSAVAWAVGMVASIALILVSTRRDTSIRLLAMTTAAAAIVVARQFAGPAGFSPVDLLLVALAMAGSVFGFILTEDSLKSPAR